MLSVRPASPFHKLARGGEKDSKGLGDLVKESLRYINKHRRRLAIMENVKHLVVRHSAVLGKIEKALRHMQYDVYTRVLKTKEHGVPQNRERLYLVAIRVDSVKRSSSGPHRSR